MNRLAHRLIAGALLLLISGATGCGSVTVPSYNASNPYDLPPHIREVYQRWEKVHRDYCRANTFELL
jgi:hypothetical protein